MILNYLKKKIKNIYFRNGLHTQNAIDRKKYPDLTEVTPRALTDVHPNPVLERDAIMHNL